MVGLGLAGSEAGMAAGLAGCGAGGGVRIVVVRWIVLPGGTGSSTAPARHPSTATRHVNTVVVRSVAVGMGTSYRASLTYTPTFDFLASAQRS
jgi:hypothetical protein